MATSFGSRGQTAGASGSRGGFKVVFGVDRVLPHAYFYVQHAYNAELNAFYQKIPDNQRVYNSKSKRWSFWFEHYDAVLAKVLSLHSVDAQPLPSFVISGVAAFAQKHDVGSLPSELELNIPPLLKSALLPHQIEGVRYIVERRGRGMIADEMGCGKTLQAIALAYYYREFWPVLVLAPASVSSKWKAELLSWDPELTDKDVKILSKEGHDVVKFGIANYDIMSKLTAKDRIFPGQFGVVIADESHYLKNREAMRTQCTVPFLTRAKVAICLSGTPALSCPVELYTQLNAMQPEIFNDYFAYTERYCNAHQSRFGRDVKGCSNADELKLLLENMVMIRRLKKDVLFHALPKKMRDIVYVEPCAVHMEEIRQLQDQRRIVDMTLRDPTLGFDVAERLKRDKQAMTTKLYALTGMCKIDAIQLQIERLVQRANAGELHLGVSTAPPPAAAAEAEPEAETGTEVSEVAVVSDSGTGNGERADDCDPHPVERRGEAKMKEEATTGADGLVDSDEEAGAKGKKTNNRQQQRKRLKMTHGPASSTSKRTVKRRLQRIGGDVDSGDGDGDGDSDSDDLAFTSTTKRWRQRDGKARGGNKHSRRSADDGNDDDDEDDDDDNGDDAFVDLTKADGDDAAERKEEDTLQEWAALLKGDGRSKKRGRSDTKDKKSKKSKKQSPTAAPAAPKPIEPTRKCDLKLVLFAHHKEVLDALEIRLTELNLSYVRIDGSTPVTARHNMITRFQEDDTTTVALLGMTACGTGVNFTRASIAIFAELYWTPGVLLQAEDRIHRIGQKANVVRIIYMLARGTADDEMWSLAQNKLAVLESTLGELEQRPAGGKGMAVGTRQVARERGQSSLFAYYSQEADRAAAAVVTTLSGSTPHTSSHHHYEHAEQEIVTTAAVAQSTLMPFLSQEKHVRELHSKPAASAAPLQPSQLAIKSPIRAEVSPVKVVAAAPVVPPAALAKPPALATSAAARPANSGELSPATRARIEENRRRALEKRAQVIQATKAVVSAPRDSPALGGGLLPVFAAAPAPQQHVAPAWEPPTYAPAAPSQPQVVARSID